MERLGKDELIELALRLQRPDKTSRNSSKPPSTDRKERGENSKPGGAKPGHEGHFRALGDDPDAFEDHVPLCCPCCGLSFDPGAERELIGEYDEIELPPIRPFVRRHRRFSIRCGRCGATTEAELPEAAKGSPFGPNIHAMAVYPKSVQLFSYERLRLAFSDLFGLTISEGALMNMFKRTQAAFEAKRDAALARAAPGAFRRLRRNRRAHRRRQRLPVGVSAARRPWSTSVDFTRAAAGRARPLDGHRPTVWTSDRYSAQQGHADRRQTCLAHLDRAARFADENSEDDAPFRLRLWFDRAFALARDITTSPPRRCAPSGAPWSAISTLS